MPTMKEKQAALAKLMKKNGATGVPQVNTYIAAAHENAMKGNNDEAMKLMQDSMNPAIPDPEVDQAADQNVADRESQKENAGELSPKNKEFIAALKKIAKGKK